MPSLAWRRSSSSTATERTSGGRRGCALPQGFRQQATQAVRGWSVIDASGSWVERRFPAKASREFIKLIRSAVENARHQFDDLDIDPEDLHITHCAAHRGQQRRRFMPRARGRATPKNHYEVNLELFIEDLRAGQSEFDDDNSEF